MSSLLNFLKVLSIAVTLGLGVGGGFSSCGTPFLYFSFISFSNSFKKETKVISVLRSDNTYVLA